MRKRKSLMVKVRKNLIVILLGIALIAWAIMTLISQQVKLMELKKEEAAYRTNIEKLRKELDAMASEIEKSQSPEFIEKMAREKLKMVKPNETIYFIEGSQKKPKP